MEAYRTQVAVTMGDDNEAGARRSRFADSFSGRWAAEDVIVIVIKGGGDGDVFGPSKQGVEVGGVDAFTGVVAEGAEAFFAHDARRPSRNWNRWNSIFVGSRKHRHFFERFVAQGGQCASFRRGHRRLESQVACIFEPLQQRHDVGPFLRPARRKFQ